MLDLKDSRNFSRTLAALGLLLGPVFLLVASLLDPAWADDRADYLGQVAGAPGRYLAAGALWSLGSLLFIPGALGIGKLLRGRAVSLGQIGAGLLSIGLILLSSNFVFYAMDVAMARSADREAALGLTQSFEDQPGMSIFFMLSFIGGIVLGSVLVAIGLLRRRIVPSWSPILLIVSTVLGFFAETQLLNVVSLVLLVVALIPLSQRIKSMSDESWARWQPLGDEPGPEPLSSTPPDAQPA